MNTQELIKSLGGNRVVAQMCDRSEQAVSNWKADGKIPASVVLGTPRLLAEIISKSVSEITKSQVTTNQ